MQQRTALNSTCTEQLISCCQYDATHHAHCFRLTRLLREIIALDEKRSSARISSIEQHPVERMRGIEWGGMEGEERIIWDWQERVGDKNIRDQVRGENKRGEVR